MKKVQINRCGMCQNFDDGWCRLRGTSVQRTENGLEYIKQKTLACCYFRWGCITVDLKWIRNIMKKPSKRSKAANDIVYYCRNCKYSKEDWKFENLSVDGRPTLLICDIIGWPKRLINEKACGDYVAKIQ